MAKRTRNVELYEQYEQKTNGALGAADRQAWARGMLFRSQKTKRKTKLDAIKIASPHILTARPAPPAAIS